ncbi:hypothetical protein NHQ30_010863 [Ciborinia camelliae]|nr:hypothetical protein NHQ30_010863 [Ciborinia camelliae]
MAQSSVFGPAKFDGVGSNQDSQLPVIPIKLPHEIWQGRQSNGVATGEIATLVPPGSHWVNRLVSGAIDMMEESIERSFTNDNSTRHTAVSLKTDGHDVIFQHLGNFDSSEEALDLSLGTGWDQFRSISQDTVTLGTTPRSLPVHALAMFTERHPNIRYIIYAIFKLEHTLPPNTTRVSLFPATPDETVMLIMSWYCPVDDKGMNEEVSNLMGQPMGVVIPDATTAFISRPYNTYMARAELI